MGFSLALILVGGLLFYALFEKIKLPGLLGMILLGILMGPFGFNLISKEVLVISSDLRKIALIVILLRAGLSIERESLHQVGLPAVLLSVIPGVFEALTVMALAMFFFDLSWIDGGVLGFILAAVSPAVIVPKMITLIERKIGAKHSVPTLILAGASIDDVVAITFFTSFVTLAIGSHVNFAISLAMIPLSVIIGLVIGGITGILLIVFFKHYHIRDTKKVMILLGVALLLTTFEDTFPSIPFASLLAIMAIGFILLEKYPILANRLSIKFNKVWVFAQLLLFVLIGAEVNIHVIFQAGWVGLIIILVGLMARSVGVWLSLIPSKLTYKEKLFTIISYWPKATVQAAIGAIPFSLNLPYGELFLAIAVLAIIVSAPLGAIAIDISVQRLLND